MKTLPKTLLHTIGLALCLSTPLGSQTPSSRPGLIRDTEVAEGKEELELKKPKEYNPLLAQNNLNIGNFYLKKKNYVAAIQRFLEAIEYQPNLTAAHDALARAYERNGEIVKAANVYRDFIRQYPESPKVAEFKSKLTKLEKK
jgi:tetratricopeptide (TPR) repeat protein